MTFADHRAQFLRNRVLTATPAQRVVMIYDRLNLDLTLARSTADVFEQGRHLDHAMQIVAELQASLDMTAGGPAHNLAKLYTYVMQQLIAARSGDLGKVDAVEQVVTPLRAAWAEAAEAVATEPAAAASGSWIG